VRTTRTYRQGLATLATTPLTKIGLAAWLRAMRDQGLTPGGINMYARSVNSFLSWAHGEGLLPERLRIRLLLDPPKPLTPISATRRSVDSWCSVHTTGFRSALGH